MWGQRWLSRDLPAGELDTDALVSDMRRRIDRDALPRSPLVARIETWVDPRRREWVRAFPRWFERYLFADIPPAR